MALSNKDIERMGDKFGIMLAGAITDINKANEPFIEELRKHGQTIYGANGDNGLAGDCKSMKCKIERIELTHAKQTGMVAAISAVVTILGISGRELIKAVFGK
jgi:hypothetical protein